MNAYLFAAMLLVEAGTVFSEISTTRSLLSFSLTLREDGKSRVVSFYRQTDSSDYNVLNYSCPCSADSNSWLAQEIPIIDSLWKIAQDSIAINLTGVTAGYPLEYRDVLANQISTFVKSRQWQDHVKKTGTALNYRMMDSLMLAANVYAPLDSLLQKHGYSIDKITTEKHGTLDDKKMQKLGYFGKEHVPIPFMVWMAVRKKE